MHMSGDESESCDSSSDIETGSYIVSENFSSNFRPHHLSHQDAIPLHASSLFFILQRIVKGMWVHTWRDQVPN